MTKLFTSASKFVFVVLTVTSCVAFLWGKLPVDQFMLLCTAAFSFYFSHKGGDTMTSRTDEFLGK